LQEPSPIKRKTLFRIVIIGIAAVLLLVVAILFVIRSRSNITTTPQEKAISILIAGKLYKVTKVANDAIQIGRIGDTSSVSKEIVDQARKWLEGSKGKAWMKKEGIVGSPGKIKIKPGPGTKYDFNKVDLERADEQIEDAVRSAMEDAARSPGGIKSLLNKEDPVEDRIYDGFVDIYNNYNRGELPKMTIHPSKLENKLERGINAADKQNTTYDGQKKVVGTIGEKLLDENNSRVVLEFDIPPENVMPRLTRDGEYHNTIVFKEPIPPENITVISAPDGFFGKDVKPPVRLDQLKAVDGKITQIVDSNYPDYFKTMSGIGTLTDQLYNPETTLKDVAEGVAEFVIPQTTGEAVGLAAATVLTAPLGPVGQTTAGIAIEEGVKNLVDKPSNNYYRTTPENSSMFNQYVRNIDEIEELNDKISQAQRDKLIATNSDSVRAAEKEYHNLLNKRDTLIKENHQLDFFIKNPINEGKLLEEAQRNQKAIMEKEGLLQTGVGPEVDWAMQMQQKIQEAEQAQEALDKYKSTGEWGTWPNRNMPLKAAGGKNETEWVQEQIAKKYEPERLALEKAQEEQRKQLGIPATGDKDVNEAILKDQISQFTQLQGEKAQEDLEKYYSTGEWGTFLEKNTPGFLGGKTEEQWEQEQLAKVEMRYDDIVEQYRENKISEDQLEEAFQHYNNAATDYIENEPSERETSDGQRYASGDRSIKDNFWDIPENKNSAAPFSPETPSVPEKSGNQQKYEPPEYLSNFSKGNGSEGSPFILTEESLAKIYEYDREKNELVLKDDWGDILGIKGTGALVKGEGMEKIIDAKVKTGDMTKKDKTKALKKNEGIKTPDNTKTKNTETRKDSFPDKDDKKDTIKKPEDVLFKA